MGLFSKPGNGKTGEVSKNAPMNGLSSAVDNYLNSVSPSLVFSIIPFETGLEGRIDGEKGTIVAGNSVLVGFSYPYSIGLYSAFIFRASKTVLKYHNNKGYISDDRGNLDFYENISTETIEAPLIKNHINRINALLNEKAKERSLCPNFSGPTLGMGAINNSDAGILLVNKSNLVRYLRTNDALVLGPRISFFRERMTYYVMEKEIKGSDLVSRDPSNYAFKNVFGIDFCEKPLEKKILTSDLEFIETVPYSFNIGGKTKYILLNKNEANDAAYGVLNERQLIQAELIFEKVAGWAKIAALLPQDFGERINQLQREYLLKK